MCVHGKVEEAEEKVQFQRTGGHSEGHPAAFLPRPDSRDMSMTERKAFPHSSL